MLLSDWTDEDPDAYIAKLKQMSDFYNFNEPTAMDFARDVQSRIANSAREAPHVESHAHEPDRLQRRDRSHLHLSHQRHHRRPANWTALFKPGEKVRLRFINGSASTIFDVRIPGLRMTVIAADGQDVEPVSVDEFRISVAETYDVIVEPQTNAPTRFSRKSIDRTGYARGTLAPRAGMQAEGQACPQWLTMTDMRARWLAAWTDIRDGHDRWTLWQSMRARPQRPACSIAPKVRHAKTEYGPGVDMRVDMPRTNLDDPGINLRNNGRRVLTYADLHTIGGPLDPRDAGP